MTKYWYLERNTFFEELPKDCDFLLKYWTFFNDFRDNFYLLIQLAEITPEIAK